MVKSRRVGFSEVIAFERACRASGINLVTGKQHRPVNQNLISASQAQSKELLEKCMRHVTALGYATPEGSLIESKSATMAKLKNGAKLIAFSSNPRTIRGFEGDVTLDEFGNTANQDKVWAAAAPLAKPTLGQPTGYQINVCGTPEGDTNRFARICMEGGDLAKSFSVHRVDIHKAVGDGFPLMVQRAGEWVRGTIEDLREEIGDSDTFDQEYCCSFLASSMRYISDTLWDACTYHPEDRPQHPPGSVSTFGGMDLARKRHQSAIVRLERQAETLWHLDTESERDMKWDQQEAWVDRKIERCSRLAIDATGLGSQFAERLEARWAGRVEQVLFTQPIKEALATGLKLVLERKRLRPRADDVALRKSVMMLRRSVTQAGNIRFDAEESKDGHGDEAWALALAVHAAGGAITDSKMPATTGRDAQRPATGAVKRGGWR